MPRPVDPGEVRQARRQIKYAMKGIIGGVYQIPVDALEEAFKQVVEERYGVTIPRTDDPPERWREEP